ncbi:twin-arginine translocase TatA/TatE family subunit [Phocicoccus pinnipedialis]|uniref:Sec-independent protein translocase protein TatA n=1 Tax=Phocicoccus pinnipedialis TaxID=110845 RepID=A0A6V7R881_9BACL|nr:twin-arginine translocase TatA/TatE family subunit [Jeotgalicoccus pinnipedialis]MBP1940133.1 sec-independent protein translocase protein TatA [Jeotgalicoccus pinnipedialis]CAD2073687.1 Sec-independent protein translocase protein TatAy [Jeotgalicoccus pinnipedialis]
MSILLPATLMVPAPISLIIIAAIALLIFGPTKLPQLGRSVGTTFKEFKAGFNGLNDEEEEEPKKLEEVSTVKSEDKVTK